MHVHNRIVLLLIIILILILILNLAREMHRRQLLSSSKSLQYCGEPQDTRSSSLTPYEATPYAVSSSSSETSAYIMMSRILLLAPALAPYFGKETIINFVCKGSVVPTLSSDWSCCVPSRLNCACSTSAMIPLSDSPASVFRLYRSRSYTTDAINSNKFALLESKASLTCGFPLIVACTSGTPSTGSVRMSIFLPRFAVRSFLVFSSYLAVNF